MAYLPTKEELKELGFTKKRDLDIYELKATKNSALYFDYAIELEHKFYAVEQEEEHLLEFDEKEEVLFFIDTLKWIWEK